MFQLYNEPAYTLSQDLSCPMLGLVSMGLVRMAPPRCLGKISGMSCQWAHTHGNQICQAESRQAWVLFSVDCAAPTGLPCARQTSHMYPWKSEHFGACLLGESHVFGREAQVSERSVHPDLTWSDRQNSLPVPETLTLTTFSMPQRSMFLNPI